MSPTRLFACMSCGHRFELSRVVAESSVSMTLCPHCGGHEVETVGEGRREPAPQPAPTADAPQGASQRVA
ncbi:MAG: FmdB family zinc ribbon protein [Thermoleophilia bacterium]